MASESSSQAGPDELQEAIASLDAAPFELTSEWDFYIDQPLVKPGEQQAHKPCGTKLLGSFSTVQEFWRFYHTLSDIQSLPKNANVQMFRHGVKPLWDDERNAHGGRWLIVVPRERVVDSWSLLLVRVLTESFEWSDDICGVVLSVRPNQTTLRLWNGSQLPQLETDARGQELMEMLNADDVLYQRHEDLARMAPSKKKRRKRRHGGQGKQGADVSPTGPVPDGVEETPSRSASASVPASEHSQLQHSGAPGEAQDDDEEASDTWSLSAAGVSPAPTPSPAATPRIPREAPPALALQSSQSQSRPSTAAGPCVSPTPQASPGSAQPSVAAAAAAAEADAGNGAVRVAAEHDPQLFVTCYRGDTGDVVRRLWGVYPNGVLRNGRRQAVEVVGSPEEGPYVFAFPAFGPLSASALLAASMQAHQVSTQQQQQQSQPAQPQSQPQSVPSSAPGTPASPPPLPRPSPRVSRIALGAAQVAAAAAAAVAAATGSSTSSSQAPSPLQLQQPPPAVGAPLQQPVAAAIVVSSAANRRAASLVTPPSAIPQDLAAAMLRRSNSYDDAQVQSTKAVQRILNKIAAERQNSWRESTSASRMLGSMVIGAQKRRAGEESSYWPAFPSPGSSPGVVRSRPLLAVRIQQQQQQQQQAAQQAAAAAAATTQLDQSWVPISSHAAMSDAGFSSSPAQQQPPQLSLMRSGSGSSAKAAFGSPPGMPAPQPQQASTTARAGQWLDALDLSGESTSLFSGSVFPGDYFLGGARVSAAARERGGSPPLQTHIDHELRSRSRRVETTKPQTQTQSDWKVVGAPVHKPV